MSLQRKYNSNDCYNKFPPDKEKSNEYSEDINIFKMLFLKNKNQ